MSAPIDRRRFLQTTASVGAAVAPGLSITPERRHGAANRPHPGPGEPVVFPWNDQPRRPYEGPRVVLVRFGGGVRRQETIADPDRTWCPFVYHELYRNKGILLNNVEIENNPKIVTS